VYLIKNLIKNVKPPSRLCYTFGKVGLASLWLSMGNHTGGVKPFALIRDHPPKLALD
jgi:hypothetical protein